MLRGSLISCLYGQSTKFFINSKIVRIGISPINSICIEAGSNLCLASDGSYRNGIRYRNPCKMGFFIVQCPVIIVSDRCVNVDMDIGAIQHQLAFVIVQVVKAVCLCRHIGIFTCFSKQGDTA